MDRYYVHAHRTHSRECHGKYLKTRLVLAMAKPGSATVPQTVPLEIRVGAVAASAICWVVEDLLIID